MSGSEEPEHEEPEPEHVFEEPEHEPEEPEPEHEPEPEPESEPEPEPEEPEPPALASNDGIFRREQERMVAMEQRLAEQRKEREAAEMENVTFSPRLNPPLPAPREDASGERDRGQAAEAKLAENAARAANGYCAWPTRAAARPFCVPPPPPR